MSRYCFVLIVLLFLSSNEMFGQPVQYFCKENYLSSNEEFAKIVEWIEKELDPSRPPTDLVHLLLSSEAMTYRWDEFPCLDLLYHYKLSDALKSVGAYDEAEKAGMIAYKIDSVIGRPASPLILSHLASIAFEKKDYASAAYYYEYGYRYVREDTNKFSALGALNNIALSYLMLDSVDKAREIFLEAFQTYKRYSLGASTLLASLVDNLADITLIKGDTLEAIRLLHQKDSILHAKTPDTLRIYDTWASLAQLYLAQEMPDKAMEYFNKASEIGTLYTDFSPEDAYRLEIIRFDHAMATNDQQAATASMKKLLILAERSRSELMDRHNIEREVFHQYADHNAAQEKALSLAQLEKKEREKLYQKRITYLASLIGLTIILSLFIYYYYKQKAHEQRINSLELSVDLNTARLKNEQLEKELIQSHLAASERELVSVAMENVRRKEWTGEVMEEIDNVFSLPFDKQQEGFKKLYLELHHQYQIQERLSLSHDNQELIQASFLQKLRSDFPDLSTSEIDLCILLRLGLTGKEIAVVRNVDPESIRKAKYRLRSKMNLATPQELHSLLNSY